MAARHARLPSVGSAHAAGRRIRSRRLMAGLTTAVVAVATAGLVAARPDPGRAADLSCVTSTSPLTGSSGKTYLSAHGLLIRRYVPAGKSPIFIAFGNTHYVKAAALFNPLIPQRRQVRDMMRSSIAAVNGDFFAGSAAVGAEVSGGVPLKGTDVLQAGLVISPQGIPTTGSVRLGLALRAKLSATVTTMVHPHSYNSVQDRSNSIAVFDNRWGSMPALARLRWPAQPAVSYLVAWGHVAMVTPGVQLHTIPPGGFLVVAQGEGNTELIKAGWRSGAAVSLATAAFTQTGARPSSFIGAGEVIMQQGLTTANACGYDSPTPRTAIAYANGMVFLVAASGRGLTMRELNSLLRGLHATDAVLMDGGGSTVMTERTTHPIQLTVHPYRNEGDRPVPNAFGLVPRGN